MEPNKTIQVKFLAGKKVQIMNLKTGDSVQSYVAQDGNISFEIKNPADYLYLYYKVIS